MAAKFQQPGPRTFRGDALVISIPKSGRTWVRTFLSAYFCEKAGREFQLDPWQDGSGLRPRIVFTHDLFEHRTKGDRWDRVRGKYLVPAAELRRARVILLARDPRDAFVSHFVQLVHRSSDTPPELKTTSASALLRHPAHGIVSIIRIMNGWLKELPPTTGHFDLVRYEDLRADPPAHFTDLLRALGENEPATAPFAHALAFSDFENMKRLEAGGKFDSKDPDPGQPGRSRIVQGAARQSGRVRGVSDGGGSSLRRGRDGTNWIPASATRPEHDLFFREARGTFASPCEASIFSAKAPCCPPRLLQHA